MSKNEEVLLKVPEMENNPKGITYTPIYTPDKDRMVKALKIVLESKADKEEKEDSPKMVSE